MRTGSLVVVLNGCWPSEGSFEGDDHIGIVIKNTPHLSTATVQLLDKKDVVEAKVDDLIHIADVHDTIQEAVANPDQIVHKALTDVQVTLFRIHTAVLKGLCPLATS